MSLLIVASLWPGQSVKVLLKMDLIPLNKWETLPVEIPTQWLPCPRFFCSVRSPPLLESWNLSQHMETPSSSDWLTLTFAPALSSGCSIFSGILGTQPIKGNIWHLILTASRVSEIYNSREDHLIITYNPEVFLHTLRAEAHCYSLGFPCPGAPWSYAIIY